jgi:hypothetical protein
MFSRADASLISRFRDRQMLSIENLHQSEEWPQGGRPGHRALSGPLRQAPIRRSVPAPLRLVLLSWQVGFDKTSRLPDGDPDTHGPVIKEAKQQTAALTCALPDRSLVNNPSADRSATLEDHRAVLRNFSTIGRQSATAVCDVTST